MNGVRCFLRQQQCQALSFKSFRGNPKLSDGRCVLVGHAKHPIGFSCKSMQTSSYEVVKGSYKPTTVVALAEEETNTERKRLLEHAAKKNDRRNEFIVVNAICGVMENLKVKPPLEIESLGAFQKLPMVMQSSDILSSAVRKARKVSPTKGIANIAKRERNRGAKQLDTLMKELVAPLKIYLEKFPDKKGLHPYERSLVELTLGDGNYEEVIKKVDSLRKKVVSVGKEHASLCAKSLSKREAEERLNQGTIKLEEIFRCEGKAVDELVNIAKTLRAMPVVQLETPTLCLVGAPNVGKSSLVRLLSSGKPEICNYPFTTRGILMGHVVTNHQRFQTTTTIAPRAVISPNMTGEFSVVTDTPGLLSRSDEKRNNLEKLTIAVLSHLPTAILFVHDLSGECGTSPSDQCMIYKEIRSRFNDHLWLDVVSKCDLLREFPVVFASEETDIDDSEVIHYRKVGPDGAIRVSVKTEEGIDELKQRVRELLVAQMERIRSKEHVADLEAFV